MRKLIYSLFILATFNCNNRNIREVTHSTKEFKFNSEIDYYFLQTKDIGFTATEYSFVSEHEKLINSLKANDTIKPISANTLLKIKNDYKPVNAINHIISKSTEHEFILINEAHFIPQHRNFLNQLLPGLAKKGYKNLALEGLIYHKKVDDKIKVNGYPEINHGAYIKEPEYGNLIRKAQKLGYNVFGYDIGSGEQREINGAKNIIDKINSFEEKGKTIVLCGWDHIKEGKTGTYWEYALAGRLNFLTGKNPLTINQTQYYERAETYFEDSLYQSLQFKEPTVLINKLDNSIDLEHNKAWYDIFVFHPRTKYKNGIPHWILKNKMLQKFNLSGMKNDFKCPCKVLLYEKNDSINNAVPTYIVEIPKMENSITMPVSKNTKYKLLIFNTENAYLIE